jgi:hypothetical protein
LYHPTPAPRRLLTRWGMGSLTVAGDAFFEDTVVVDAPLEVP